MALNTSSIGTIGDAAPAAGELTPNHKFYRKDFIQTAQVSLVYDMFGEPAAIPNNMSNVIVFNKVAILPTTENSPLTEGVDPVDQLLSITRIEKAVNQFGGVLTTTDRLQGESINGITIEANRIIARQGGETMNLVKRNDLQGGTNVYYQGGVATRDAILTSALTDADYTFMYQGFKLARAKPKTRLSGGSTNIGTLPQKAQFACVYPVEMLPLLEGLDDGNGKKFVGSEQYSTQRNLWPDEEGSFKQFAFLTNTEAEIVVNAAATPQNIAIGLVFGEGAYKTLSLGNAGVEVITKPLDSGGVANPLNLRATHAWKARQGSMIVQDTYMFRHEVSVGDN